MPAELTTTLHEVMPFAALIGAEAVSVSADEVRLRLAWDPTRCTAGGMLHGGAVMALADTGGGWCASMNLPEGATGTATVESKTNFLRGVTSGAIESVSTVLHAGRMFVVVDTEVRDTGTGKLVARVTQTQAVLRR
jgi:1,4-dihydroxy-2-naphthoyl-CoA hydrolase